MIRFSLVCPRAHEFDGWFRSSADYDRQATGGLLGCPVCGDVAVTKALMAPRVVTSEARAVDRPSEAEPVPQPAVQTEPMALAATPPEAREIIDRFRELKAEVLKNSEDVGGKFAEEARRIHFGEAPQRAVHGQATAEEAKALVEEGIEIMPLPVLPDEMN